PGGLFANDDRPWQMATPDRVILPHTGGNIPGDVSAVLECKTSATRDGWGSGELPEPHDAEWAEARSTVPAYVRAQVLWQMDTLSVATGHVAVVFLPSGEFRSYTITHQHDPWLGGDDRGPACPFVQGSCQACNDIALMREKAHEFYRRITGDLPAPPVDHLTVTTKALQDVYARLDDTLQAELDPELYDAWVTYRAIARNA